MNQLIVSCSLSSGSKSAILARRLDELLRKHGETVELIDLRELELPFCDGGPCYGHENVQRLQEAFVGADAVTIATPIYNFETGGATRNLVALTGKKCWQDKIVGFLCAAGGQGSYMSIMGLANSLMLDFRCLIIPRFVFATGGSFDESNAISDPDVETRIASLAGELKRLRERLSRPDA